MLFKKPGSLFFLGHLLCVQDECPLRDSVHQTAHLPTSSKVFHTICTAVSWHVCVFEWVLGTCVCGVGGWVGVGV